MNFLSTVKLVLQLLPLIIEAVKAIEAAIPEGGAGAAKLAAVRNILQASYTATGGMVDDFEKLWPALSGAIGAVVGLFNNTGVFQRS